MSGFVSLIAVRNEWQSVKWKEHQKGAEASEERLERSWAFVVVVTRRIIAQAESGGSG